MTAIAKRSRDLAQRTTAVSAELIGEDAQVSWFVVMSKPRQEMRACSQLREQGYDVYLPQIEKMQRQHGTFLRTELPMFPRYLFVQLREGVQSLAQVRATRGVSQVVRFGTEYARAADSLIADVRNLEKRMRASNDLAPFKPDQWVEITEGAFVGVTAQVLSCAENRVCLLLNLLGSARQLTFPIESCRIA
jgi:transcriptional antiterminator RfaH